MQCACAVKCIKMQCLLKHRWINAYMSALLQCHTYTLEKMSVTNEKDRKKRKKFKRIKKKTKENNNDCFERHTYKGGK